MKEIKEELRTPVAGEYDVIVAGAGTAGICAAIAAAREGARTLIIEENGFVGGSVVDSAGPLHSFFNGYATEGAAPKTQLVHGIAQLLIDKLCKAGGSFGHLEQSGEGNKVDPTATLTDRETVKYVFLKELYDHGADVLLYTKLVGTVHDDNELQGVILENKSGRQIYLAKCFIDCTGDGDLACLAGAEYQDASVSGAVSMPFGMAGVDTARLEAYAVEKGLLKTAAHADKPGEPDALVRIIVDCTELPGMGELLKDPFALKNGEGSIEDRATVYSPMCVSFRKGELNYINSTIVVGLKALNAMELTQANFVLRELVWKMSEILRQYLPGFEQAYINWTPTMLGIRRTRIIACEYDLSLAEIVSGVRFDDEIGLYGYMDMAPKIMIEGGRWYGIPYRALVPKRIENLLVAGRMITSDFKAHMSTRNTPSCMLQGEAVGTAAAMAVKDHSKVRDLDVNKLRERLRSNGVYLG